MCVNKSTREIFALTGLGSDENLQDFYPRRIMLALWRVFSPRLNKQESLTVANCKKKIEYPYCSCQQKHCSIGGSNSNGCGCAHHYSCNIYSYDGRTNSDYHSNGYPAFRRKCSGCTTYCSNSLKPGKVEKNAGSISSKLQQSFEKVIPTTNHCVFTSNINDTDEKSSSVPQRRFSIGFRGLLVLFYLLILVGSSMGCGPGRGAGRRRAPRKLTPLVYKQHVPNVPENTLSASGLNEGKITRDHPRFKALVPNYNTDIIFRDDEGSGADRLMTQRCKEKLNTLAISVMNQWPGVKLRVIEGWDEENLHAQHSLHYEGRAVDITTSDKDRSKYGMLARLAVEAGFDWVYYESRAHIHCSVKSDSSQAARTGGCFSGNTTVETRTGVQKISEIQPGDEILTISPEGVPTYSEVLLFLDRNASETREFYIVNLESGRSLTLTPSHLLYFISPESLSLKEVLQLERDGSRSTTKFFMEEAEITFARNIEQGYWLLVQKENSSDLVYDRISTNVINSDDNVEYSNIYTIERVVGMEVRVETGVYAPLTSTGNLIVDGVLASCYAVIDDQKLAHWAFAPVRLAHNFYVSISRLWRQFSRFITFSQPDSNASIKNPSDNLVTNNHLQDNKVSNTHNNPRANTIHNDHQKPFDKLSRNYIQKEQGVHWYASFLYSSTKHVLPSYLLYS